MQQPENNVTPSTLHPARPSLLDYLLVIAKQKKMIFFVTVGAVVIAVITSYIVPNIYTAKAMIMPSEDDKGGMSAFMSQLGGLTGAAGGALGTKTTGELYVTMMKSETIKDPIIDRFKLLDQFKTKSRADVYATLDRNVAISLGKKDGVLTIMVRGKEPKQTADIANAYVDELGKLAAGLNMTRAGMNRVYLEKRIAEARADLIRAEDTLKQFQIRNKSISVTDQAKASIEGVAQLRAKLAVQEVQLATFQRQFTETSQEVKTTKAAVANLRAQISGAEGNEGSVSSIPSVGNVPQLGQEYLRIMREFKIQEAVLEMLSKQYEVSKLTESKDVIPLQVLQKAKVPEKRTSPKRRKMVMLGGMLGFALSIMAAFSLEALRTMSNSDKNRWKQIVKGV